MCAGSSVVLMDSVAGGVWSSGSAVAIVSGGTITGISAGTDTIKYRVSNICGATTATKPVTVNPMPAAGNITGTDSLCVGNSVALTENVGGGVWSCSNASATVGSAGVVTGITEGIDTVIYTVSNAWCSADAELAVKVIGLADCGALTSPRPSPEERVTIYPNPASNELHIDNGADCVVSIFNIMGQKVYEGRIVSDQEVIAIGQLIAGSYIVQVDLTPALSSGAGGITRITTRLVIAK